MQLNIKQEIRIIQDIVDLKITDFIAIYNNIEKKEEIEDNDLELFFEIDYDDIEDDKDLVEYIQTNIDIDEKRIKIFMHIIEEAIDKICSDEGMDIDGIEFIIERIGDDILSHINELYDNGGGEDPIITKKLIEGKVITTIEDIKDELEISD